MTPSTSDDGANRLQNYPLLESVSKSTGSANVKGKLNSTPNTQFRLEFFRNDTVDPSGFGEGQVFSASGT